MGEQALFDFGQPGFQDGAGEQLAPKADKGANHLCAHGDGAFTVQDGCGHDGAVFRKNPRA